MAPNRGSSLLYCLAKLKGLAVSALVHGRVCFMGANCDAVQRTVIICAAVVRTLGYSAADTFVCIAFFHLKDLP